MNYDISEYTGEIKLRFDALKQHLHDNFAATDDVDYGRNLIKCLDEVDELNGLLTVVEDRFDLLVEGENLSDQSIIEVDRQSGLRKFSIEISQGMINQSLLSLTKAKKNGLVKVGERMVIHPPEGSAFETKISKIGNRLEARGRIGAFFLEHGVEEFDQVVLEEIKPKHWKLSVDETNRQLRLAAERAALEL